MLRLINFAKKRFFFALLMIAICAVSVRVNGQNGSRNPIVSPVSEATERERIARERLRLQRSYDEQSQACYQQLAVTPCIAAARDSHNEQLRDLRRQEVALNDAQRKRKAGERLRSLDERHSSQVQVGQAQRRGAAMELAKQREQISAEKQAMRDARLQAVTNSSASSESKSQRLPQGKPRRTNEPKLSKSLRQGGATKLDQGQQAAAQREQAATERRKKQALRETARKKPPAAPLPVPP